MTTRSPSRYRYLAYDLLTRTPLEELPLRDVSFEYRLNGSGSFSATLPVGFKTQAGVSLDRNYLGACDPLQTAIYVERDDVLVWGGWIIGRRRSKNDGTVQLAGADFFSFLGRQNLEVTKQYFVANGHDQFDIVRDLVLWVQTQAGGNVNLQVTAGDSGVLRDRTYYSYEAKSIGEAIQQLSDLENGFDFAIDVAYVGGVPTPTLSLHYPRRGRTLAQTELVWDLGRNMLEYDWPEDGGRTANRVIGIGAGDGLDMLVVTSARPDLIDLGYPRLSTVVTYKDVSIRSTLVEHTDAVVNALGLPTVAPTITAAVGTEPALGSFIVGDEARIRIEDDDLFPAQADGSPGLDATRRLISYTVRPGDAGETMTLTFAEA